MHFVHFADVIGCNNAKSLQKFLQTFASLQKFLQIFANFWSFHFFYFILHVREALLGERRLICEQEMSDQVICMTNCCIHTLCLN